MTKLTDLKLSLAKRILDSTDADQLRVVDDLLSEGGPVRLTAKEKAELDQDHSDFTAGKGRNYSWAEVKAHALRWHLIWRKS